MSTSQVETLMGKLEKGHRRTQDLFGALSSEQWEQVLYREAPPWTVKDLLAHFLSAEGKLLLLAQNVAAGGEGAPAGFDYDAFNRAEVQRLAGWSPAELLAALTAARRATLDWLRTLEDSQLQQMGRHPALGEVTLETMITAIYGHQLLHVRDLAPLLRG